MRTVLFVTTVAATEGPGRALAAVIRAMPPTWRIVVCALTSVNREFVEALGGRVVETHALGMRHRYDLGVARRLLRVVRAVRPDVVHTHLSRSDWVGRVVARYARVPAVVSTIHNIHSRMYPAEFGPVSASIGHVLDRLTASAADAFVAVSPGVARDLERQGVARDRIRVILNGLDLGRRARARSREEGRRRWEIPHDALVVGTCAGHKAQKALDVLVDAAAMLPPMPRPVEVLVFGDGPLRPALEARVAARRGSATVRLLGWQENAMEWLPAFDVFVLASRWEGLPVALLEAMSLGVPAVGSRVSGVEDVIEDGRTGLLVPADDAAALADAIGRMLTDAALRVRLGASGRALIEASFTAEATSAAHVDLYERLLAASPRRARAARRPLGATGTGSVAERPDESRATMRVAPARPERTSGEHVRIGQPD